MPSWQPLTWSSQHRRRGTSSPSRPEASGRPWRPRHPPWALEQLVPFVYKATWERKNGKIPKRHHHISIYIYYIYIHNIYIYISWWFGFWSFHYFMLMTHVDPEQIMLSSHQGRRDSLVKLRWGQNTSLTVWKRLAELTLVTHQKAPGGFNPSQK